MPRLSAAFPTVREEDPPPWLAVVVKLLQDPPRSGPGRSLA